MAAGVPQSFSPYRKWRVGFKVLFMSLVVLSVIVMANHLSRDYFKRIYLNERTKITLHPRTLKLLGSITNDVKVTLYYDKKEELYSTVAEVLGAYSRQNPKISVETVDYQRDPAGAQKLKEKYRLGAATDKNLVIFESAGTHRVVNGNSLAEYTLEPTRSEGETKYRRKPVTFRGEQMFTSYLLAVTSGKISKAYFLQGHGEHVVDSPEDTGYMKFAAALRQSVVDVANLNLLGTNPVPADCSVLIVGGPRAALSPIELEKIEKYLNEGGRLFALFNTSALGNNNTGKATGLEALLSRFGVLVTEVSVSDPDQSQFGSDVVVSAFSKHAMVNPLVGYGIVLDRPRPIINMGGRNQSSEGPRVEPVAFTGKNAFVIGDTNRTRRQFPLIAVMEQGAAATAQRGASRMVIAGDSFFLDNALIDAYANRDFAICAMDWLLDRTQLVEGLGARPVTEYRLIMTKTQYQQAQWILLGAMPGSVLLLGGLVWIRRRK